MQTSGITPKMFAERLRSAANNLDDYAAYGAQSIAGHIAARGYANAPILTGALRSNIWASPASKISGHGYESVVKMLNETQVWYTPLMYVFLNPHAVFPLYNLGPRSAQQPNTPEGGVGGQWFLRVATFHQAQHFRKLAAGIVELFTHGRSSPLRFSS